MDKQAAIAELIAAIEEGDSDAVSRILEKNACDARNIGEHSGWTHDAEKAYGRKSLDAAKALHEALLPGWIWQKSGGKISVQHWEVEHTHTDYDVPARAWLVAILKAYQAQLAEAKE